MHTKYGTARSWYTYRYGTSVSMQLAGSLHVDSCDEPCTRQTPRRAATWTHVRSVLSAAPRGADAFLCFGQVWNMETLTRFSVTRLDWTLHERRVGAVCTTRAYSETCYLRE